MGRWFRRYGLLLGLLAAQGAYWYNTKDTKPDLGIVPPVPGEKEVRALTFGDDQFYFRLLAFDIQNAGDTFGRFTSLRYYDMSRLYHWFQLLDKLDSDSNMLPAMATYYFSQTQNTTDVRYIVDYLYEHSMRDVPKKWWWLMQSIYLAQHKLKDMDLAAQVSAPLVNPKVPAFAQQMAAVVREKRGEMEDALAIMQSIQEHAEEIKEEDLKYMRYFVDERLKTLESRQKEQFKKSIESAQPRLKEGATTPIPHILE